MQRQRAHYSNTDYRKCRTKKTVSEPLSKLTDEMVAAKWTEIAPMIEIVSARVEDPNDFVLQPFSSLAEDDIATSPYQ